MTPTTESELTQDLIDRGMKLAPAERQKFAHLLLDSMSEDEEGYTEEELQAELTRRLDDYVNGKEQAIPGDEYLAALRSRIERGRKA
jgi:putative addiction module component (TIGR02574 family)